MFNVINYAASRNVLEIVLFNKPMDYRRNDHAEMITEYRKQSAACLILRNKGNCRIFL